jgi:photosystem II stability/assembly factor-like uncharacterized protein
MKRICYSILISSAIFLSFGFKGCELEYCQFLFNMNNAVGRFTAEEEYEFFVASDSGIYHQDLFQCLAELVGPEEAFYRIAFFPFGLRGGPGIYCSVGNAGKVILSPDGGKTWEDRSISGLTENLYGFAFVDYGGTDVPVVVCGEAGTMYISTNSGSGWSWTKVNTPTTENINSIIAMNKSLFIAVGDAGTILKTYDQGNSWEDHTVGGANFNSIFDGSKIQAFGYLWIAGDDGRIFATTNYGINWFPQNSGVTENLHDIQFRNQTEGMVVGDNGVVRYTTDGGTTWQADSYFNGLTDGDILSLSTVDFNTGLAVIRNTTLDGGVQSSMFIVSSEPLSADDDLNKIPSDFSLEQNYPNPFNPTTNFEFRIAKGGFVSLKIYDLLGKEVATVVNEEKSAGNYKVDFNASGISSGVYFYKLTTRNFTQTKKLVLLR